MTFGVDGIEVGILTFSTFGLIVVASVLISTIVNVIRLRDAGQDIHAYLKMVAMVIVSGVIAGRLVFILNLPPSVAGVLDVQWYSANWLDIQLGPAAVWSGGLDPAGVMLGCGLAFWLSARRQELDLPMWLNLLAPGIHVALIMLPWANLVNRDFLGRATTLPWAIMNREGVPVHPIPAYASLWMLVCSVLVFWVSRRRPKLMPAAAPVISAYGLYAVGLFALEFMRVDVSRTAGLTSVQILLTLVFTAGTIGRFRNTDTGDSVT